MSNKKLYSFLDIDDNNPILILLTDEQAAVFYWLRKQGYDFTLKRTDDEPPIEIDPKDWIE